MLCKRGGLILAIIPARQGSKGLPQKNLKKINGLSLVAHSIKQAQQAESITSIIVTTDCPKIKQIAKYHGATIHNRPSWLASDTANLRDVVQNVEPEREVCVLLPTYPFRLASDIDKAISLMDGETPSVLCRYPALSHPCLCMDQNSRPYNRFIYRRQDRPPAFVISHYVVVADMRQELDDGFRGEDTIYVTLDQKPIDIDDYQSYKEALCKRR